MNQKQRDLLCKMIRDKADVIRGELGKKLALGFQRSNSSWKTSVSLDQKNIQQLPQSIRKRWQALRDKQEKLEQERNRLSKAVFNVEEEACKIAEQQKIGYDKACDNLGLVVDTAIVNVQFAESADEARAIIDSLPSVKQLLAESKDD